MTHLGLHGHDRQRLVDQVVDVHLFPHELLVSGLEARIGEHLVHEHHEMLAARPDARELLLLERGERSHDLVGEDLGVADHRGERRAELVRHRGEEVRLRPARLLRLPVKPRVVGEDAHAVPELLGEEEVGVGVAPARAGHEPGDDAEHGATRAQRRHQRRRHAKLLEDAQLGGAQREWVREPMEAVAHDGGPSRRDHLGGERSLAGRRRLALAQLSKLVVPLARGRRHRDAAEPSLLIEQVDEAPVAEERHAQGRQALESELGIERAGEHPRGPGKKGAAAIGVLSGQRSRVD